MKSLAARELSVRFGKVQALAGVDLETGAGQCLTLVGPNGAGKSTLLRVLLGLVRPNAGRLEVDGRPCAVDGAFKERLGYLPEAVAFAETLSGRQVLGFFARARGCERRRVDAVLERVGLSQAAARAVRGYSRGMRQRLGLGIAILSEPELLILDEPTGGLDQEGLTVLWSVIAEWRRAGRVVLMATHELGLVERRVDRICLLRGGSVRAVDTPARLREIAGLPVRVSFKLRENAPRTPELIECMRRRRLDGDLRQGDGTLGVEVRPEELLSLLDLSAGFSEAVEAVRVEEPGLDMVYERLLEGDA